ncbi:hypothetical protein DFH09DRAFT_1082415 [Mycena vulgaris]|nr:hypothetical protein DFH09DRAFT_1082415 [Mycena vulgaris]
MCSAEPHRLQVWRQEVSGHAEGILNVQTRAVPVPLSSGKNGRRNGHGTRVTGAVEPWPRSRAAALEVRGSENMWAALARTGENDMQSKARRESIAEVAEGKRGKVTWEWLSLK